MIRMLAAIGFATVLCGCSQTPAKIADLSPERLAANDDTALCDAVNSSTRSAEVVAEVKRRMIPCDSIATWCLQQGHEDGSEPFRGCVAQIEQRWRDQRDAVEKGLIWLPVFCRARLAVLWHTKKMPRITWGAPGYQFEAAEVDSCLRQNRIESTVMPLAESIAITEIMDQVREMIGMQYPGE